VWKNYRFFWTCLIKFRTTKKINHKIIWLITKKKRAEICYLLLSFFNHHFFFSLFITIFSLAFHAYTHTKKKLKYFFLFLLIQIIMLLLIIYYITLNPKFPLTNVSNYRCLIYIILKIIKYCRYFKEYFIK
jgi:hypothetical protein